MHSEFSIAEAAELIPCILIRCRSSLPVQATNGSQAGDPVQLRASPNLHLRDKRSTLAYSPHTEGVQFRLVSFGSRVDWRSTSGAESLHPSCDALARRRPRGIGNGKDCLRAGPD